VNLGRGYLLKTVVFVVAFVVASTLPAISTAPGFITISNQGKISGQVLAKSGSPGDIQAAVNLVSSAGGGTVYIPAGTFYWKNETVTIPGGVSIVGTGNTTTVLHSNVRQPFNDFFQVDGSNGKPVRISSIRFEGNVTNWRDDNVGASNAISVMNGAIDFRIDHCVFIDFPNQAIGVTAFDTGTTRGVIDHNYFDNSYKDTSPPVGGWWWAYGIVVAGKAGAWDNNIADFLGKYETVPSGFPVVYIEDNIFSRCRHAIASNQGAWYVARYNTFNEGRPQNFGNMDVHGAGGGSKPGGRGLEAYNNTIIGSSGYNAAQAFWIRGGGGLIYNNAMHNILYGIGLFNESGPSQSQVHDLYIWGNTMDSGTLLNPQNYTQDTDYFLYARPGYTPYAYPHPLTLGT